METSNAKSQTTALPVIIRAERGYNGGKYMQTYSQRSDNPAEFDQIVCQVRQSRINSGRSQAECVASSYGPQYGFDPADLMAASDKTGPGVMWGR